MSSTVGSTQSRGDELAVLTLMVAWLGALPFRGEEDRKLSNL
jgi:hypothetical protein